MTRDQIRHAALFVVDALAGMDDAVINEWDLCYEAWLLELDPNEPSADVLRALVAVVIYRPDFESGFPGSVWDSIAFEAHYEIERRNATEVNRRAASVWIR